MLLKLKNRTKHLHILDYPNWIGIPSTHWLESVSNMIIFGLKIIVYDIYSEQPHLWRKQTINMVNVTDFTTYRI